MAEDILKPSGIILHPIWWERRKSLNTCIVIGAGDCSVPDIQLQEGDFCIAVDGGYAYCKKFGIFPGLIVGDMDSLDGNLQEEVKKIEAYFPGKVIRLCPKKDDTDTLTALKIGMERGYRQFRIYGAMGGLIEHTIANIQCLIYLKNNGAKGSLLDEGVAISVLKEESVVFGKEREGYFSLFSLGEKAEGVTITGMKYPLDNALVTNGFPIGVSNEFIGKESRVSVKKGMLRLILSRR